MTIRALYRLEKVAVTGGVSFQNLVEREQKSEKVGLANAKALEYAFNKAGVIFTNQKPWMLYSLDKLPDLPDRQSETAFLTRVLKGTKWKPQSPKLFPDNGGTYWLTYPIPEYSNASEAILNFQEAQIKISPWGYWG